VFAAADRPVLCGFETARSAVAFSGLAGACRAGWAGWTFAFAGAARCEGSTLRLGRACDAADGFETAAARSAFGATTAKRRSLATPDCVRLTGRTPAFATGTGSIR
jgi:hypothetical protein